MARKKVKFALVTNDNLRAISLKKRRLGLVKKVRELTILCDVKACLIMFSPREAEPMVWPSVEMTRDLLDGYFALPDFTKKKKETNLESYLKEKTWRVQENLKETQKKNMECTIDQLMVQLSRGRKFADRNWKEIYPLLSFLKDAIVYLRNKLDFVQHPPLRDPPVHPSEAPFEEFMTTKDDDVTVGGGLRETARKTFEEVKRLNIGTVRETQSYYLMDQWFFPSFQSPNPCIHQQTTMITASYNGAQDPYFPYERSYHPYQGSSSNGDHHLEMEPICPPVLTLHGLARSVSQPFQQHHNMNDIPTMAMNQPRQYPFDFMSCEGQSCTNHDGFHQEPPLSVNGVTAEESDVGVRPFDINKDWSEINNHHF